MNLINQLLLKKYFLLKPKSSIFTQISYRDTKMNNIKSINANHFKEYILQTDITKLINLLDTTVLQDGESSVHYCFINKSEVKSSLEAFYILGTRLIITGYGWDDLYRNHEPPVYIDKQYLNEIIREFFYIEDNVIQFSALSTNITAKQFAKYLYYFINLHEDSNFINDIMDKFPLISLFELVDNPDNYMKDLGYFMETEFHYIYVTSFTSG